MSKVRKTQLLIIKVMGKVDFPNLMASSPPQGTPEES